MYGKLVSLLVSTTAIVGCASPYISPANGPIATLTIPVFTDKWVTSSASVQIAPKNINGCGTFTQHIRPETFEKDLTFNIVGDSDIFFFIERNYGAMFCGNIYGQFHASKNNKYILNVRLTEGVFCDVSVVETNADGSSNRIPVSPAYASKFDGIKVCDSKDKL